MQHLIITMPEEKVRLERVTSPPPSKAHLPDTREVIGQWDGLYFADLELEIHKWEAEDREKAYYFERDGKKVSITPTAWDPSGHIMGGLITALVAERRAYGNR